LRAHESYLKGLYYWHARHTDELPRALEYFEQAAREDPKYARAHAGVALAYAVVPQYTPVVSIQTAIREGKAAAARAIALDPEAADAHAALGQIAQEFEWDWASAEKHYDRALKLDPTYATAHQWRAELHMTLGQFDASLKEINRALMLDPLSSVMQQIRAFVLYKSGRVDEAIAGLRSVVRSDPGFRSAPDNLLGFLLMAGRYDDARRLIGDDPGLVLIAGIENPAKVVAALQFLAAPEVRQRMNFSQLAVSYLLLGQQDSAAAVFNRGADAHEIQIYLWPRDPITQTLNSQAQFKEFRRKLNL
jgi:tetratricopeptide (TPR) repeat protein